jgi:hypothetical protein
MAITITNSEVQQRFLKRCYEDPQSVIRDLLEQSKQQALEIHKQNERIRELEHLLKQTKLVDSGVKSLFDK